MQEEVNIAIAAIPKHDERHVFILDLTLLTGLVYT